MNFEWEENKNKISITKHGLSFGKAIYVFSNKENLSIFDEKDSNGEERWITIGRIENQIIVVVVYTHRYLNNTESIRFISARRANKLEIKEYYQQFKK